MCRWNFRAAIRASACRRSTTSRSTSARASSSACSARPAAARARCSTSSAACSRRPSGTVTVNGAPVTSPRPNEIAYVFQESTLFPWFTVLENFRLALKFRGIEEANWRDRAMQSLSAVGMEQFASHYPKQLSVGMKQRINLARGICVGSEVLLLDEPFAALDEQTRMVLGEDLSILLARTRQDHRVRHPFAGRGGVPRRPHHRDDGAAGQGEGQHPGAGAASALARFHADRRVPGRSARSSTACCATRSGRPSPPCASRATRRRDDARCIARERQARHPHHPVRLMLVGAVRRLVSRDALRATAPLKLFLPAPELVWREMRRADPVRPAVVGALCDAHLHRPGLCDRRRRRDRGRLRGRALAHAGAHVRAGAVGHVRGAADDVLPAVRAVLRHRAGFEGRLRRDLRVLPDRAQHHRGVLQRRRALSAGVARHGRVVLAAVPLRLHAGGAAGDAHRAAHRLLHLHRLGAGRRDAGRHRRRRPRHRARGRTDGDGAGSTPGSRSWSACR